MAGLFGAAGALAFGEGELGEADALAGDLELWDVAGRVANLDGGGVRVEDDAGERRLFAAPARLLDLELMDVLAERLSHEGLDAEQAIDRPAIGDQVEVLVAEETFGIDFGERDAFGDVTLRSARGHAFVLVIFFSGVVILVVVILVVIRLSQLPLHLFGLLGELGILLEAAAAKVPVIPAMLIASSSSCTPTGCQLSMMPSLSSSHSSGDSTPSTMKGWGERMPCLTALRLERALPSGVLGPPP